MEDVHSLEGQQFTATDASSEMSAVRFEIHTDEHGQIINIQPATMPGDINTQTGTINQKAFIFQEN